MSKFINKEDARGKTKKEYNGFEKKSYPNLQKGEIIKNHKSSRTTYIDIYIFDLYEIILQHNINFEDFNNLID